MLGAVQQMWRLLGSYCSSNVQLMNAWTWKRRPPEWASSGPGVQREAAVRDAQAMQEPLGDDPGRAAFV